ncbi:MAG: zinc-ribbon domain-containing protein, partial [Gammaproteobacteria bacterium]
MSFNVTQCPACESTFNTNSRVLAAAAGKVRCGACLNVFEAIDNFLIPE